MDIPLVTQTPKKEGSKQPISMYPGARPKPINVDSPDGLFSKRTSTAIVYVDRPQDDPTIDIKDNEAITTPRKTRKTECNQGNRLREKCGVHANGGYNPILFFSIAYFGAAAMLMLTINITVLPDLYYPTIGNLLPRNILNESPERVLVIIVLWGLHYVRRFGEVLYIHDYKRGVPIYEAVGSIIYYCFFGFWIGWSINYNIENEKDEPIGYLTPPDYLFIPGILICIAGGIGNCICHIRLRILRKRIGRRIKRWQQVASFVSDKSKHAIPKGGCFELVSCPHYSFEIVTWFGFAVTTFTLAAWTFCVVSTIVLCIYAKKKHNAYIKEFNGEDGMPLYPHKRKAIIPFIF